MVPWASTNIQNLIAAAARAYRVQAVSVQGSERSPAGCCSSTGFHSPIPVVLQVDLAAAFNFVKAGPRDSKGDSPPIP